jgi:hypothetical protein
MPVSDVDWLSEIVCVVTDVSIPAAIVPPEPMLRDA